MKRSVEVAAIGSTAREVEDDAIKQATRFFGHGELFVDNWTAYGKAKTTGVGVGLWEASITVTEVEG